MGKLERMEAERKTEVNKNGIFIDGKSFEEYADEIIELVKIHNSKENAPVSYKDSITLEMPSKNRVNHPNHYNKGIETIDYIESWEMNFNIGNVIKYTTRAGYKDNKLEDLQKAKWYLEREIGKAKGNI